MDGREPGPDRDPTDGDTTRSARLRHRREGVQARIGEIQDRLRQLAERKRGGPSADVVERAREHADHAEQAARTAHVHAAESHEEAAALHSHVADVLEQHGRTDQAREHRTAAVEDLAHAADDRAATPDGPA